MKNTFVIILLLPIWAFGQSDLTGIWRLKDSKNFKGPNYVNAIPILIKIEQKDDKTVFASTFNDGHKDTVITENLLYVEKGFTNGVTPGGRKKVTSFSKIESGWLKQTAVFNKEDSNIQQSVSKETYNVNEDGNTLRLLREYDASDYLKTNQDFTIRGTYEKVTPEQLAKETALGNGVAFIEGLTWEQIKAKAKKENKYIFVDCYATWCRPCKMMDKYVYPLNMVGNALNSDFISVKVQMDSTKFDSDNIKMLYPVARMMEKEYNINALPTYLFFSPEGNPLHKTTGQFDSKKFIELVAKTKQPDNQVYTLFNKAQQRQLPWAEYPELAKRLRTEFAEKSISLEVARLYYQQYLQNLNEKEFLTKSNLDFIGQYPSLVKSSDKVFQLCIKRPDLIDSIKQYSYGSWSEYIVTQTIFREDVKPMFQIAEKLQEEPNWELLGKQLKNKYSEELSKSYVLYARVDWYEKKENWASFLSYVSEHLKHQNLKKIDPEHLHRCAWNVFKYSNDTSLLKDALKWTDIVTEKTSKELLWMTMDTKACLLYKIGKKTEGIQIMKKIIRMFPDQKETFQDRYNRMLNNEQIWLIFS